MYEFKWRYKQYLKQEYRPGSFKKFEMEIPTSEEHKDFLKWLANHLYGNFGPYVPSKTE